MNTLTVHYGDRIADAPAAGTSAPDQLASAVSASRRGWAKYWIAAVVLVQSLIGWWMMAGDSSNRSPGCIPDTYDDREHMEFCHGMGLGYDAWNRKGDGDW